MAKNNNTEVMSEENLKATRSIKDSLLYVVTHFGIVLVAIAIIIIVGVLEPNFMTGSNFTNILKQISVIGIVSCGAAFVIIGGMIDLSVGSIISLCAVLYVMFYNMFGVGVAFILSLLIGAACGLCSGVIVSKVKGNMGVSFIVTYGMQSILAAFAILVTNGLYQNGDMKDPDFMALGNGWMPIIILAISVVFCQILLTKTKAGRRMYFLGGNEEIARLTGVKTGLHRTMTFMLSGIFSALGAMVMVSRVGSASPSAGTGYEMDVIAGIVVGGVALSGGRGNMINVFIGTAVIGLLSNALNLLGISSYPQLIVKGALIVCAVLIDIVSKNREQKSVKAH